MNFSFYTTKEFSYSQGIFIERPNRFIAFVNYNNTTIRCHVPDPGRLKEILYPGVTVLLRFPLIKTNEKTDAGLIGVYVADSDIWVSTDSQLASRYIREEWKNLPVFKEYDQIKPEFTYGESRIDFLLQNSKKSDKCLIEVKTVGLKKEDNIGYFPDAPTKRGVKHVHELVKAKEQDSYRSVIVFFVPRSDVLEVKPNKEIDTDFYNAVKHAYNAGVEFVALRNNFKPEGIRFDCQIPFNVD